MAELTLNPHTELVLTRRGGDLVEITAAAPIRGRALAITTFSKEEHPALFDLLRRLAERSGAVSAELKRAEQARLRAAGLLVPVDEIPQAVRFRSPLADPPRELLPRGGGRAKGARGARSGESRVNPTLRFYDEQKAPDATKVPRSSAIQAKTGGFCNPLADDCAWAFVEHPDAAVPSAISLSEAERAVIRRLTPGAPPPSDLTKTTMARLREADIVLDMDEAARRRDASRKAQEEARARLARDRYAILRGILAPRMLAGLRRYYRDLIAEGHVSFGDPQVRRRYRAHNEPMARGIHKTLLPLVTELAGEPMKPSYVYLGSYRAPSVLKPHVDRPQCALSISLLIDYAPEPDGPSPWPLYLKNKARPRPPFAAELHLGDGLFYRGTELTHWRDALPRGHASTSLFFHFVPADFSGSLD